MEKKPKNDLKIEIVAFYPYEIHSKGFKGSLHVYLKSLGIHYRGIEVHVTEKKWWFGFPSRLGFDEKKQENCRFTVFSFQNREQTKNMHNFIIKHGKEFILKKMYEGQPQEGKNESKNS
jgi:hypothetical protein